MRIGKIAGIAVATLVAIVAAGAAYLTNLDVDEYRSEIAQAAQDATGRVLRLQGPLSLSVSLTPTVSGEGISLGNAPWGSRSQMMTLRRFEVQLRLLPLLFGDIRINRLILIEPDILLETDAKGTGNWIFRAPAEERGKTAADGGGAVPHIGRLMIENGLLTYRNGVNGETTKVKLVALEAEAGSVDDALQLNVLASFNDMSLKLNGAVGPLKNAFSTVKPLQIDLTAEVLGLRAKIKGSAKATTGVMDAHIEVRAADLSGLQSLVGGVLPANVAMKLGVQLSAAGHKVSLSDLHLDLGNSHLAGSLSMDTGGKLPKLTAELSGKRLDLTQLRPATKDHKAPAGSKVKRPGKIFPAERLPLDVLKALDADVKISLAEVVTPSLKLQDLTAVAILKNGHLRLDPVALTAGGSSMQASASVDASSKIPTVSFELAAPKLDVGGLLAESKTTALLQGTGDLSVKLAGRGESVATVAGSLNGGIKLLMNEGMVKTAAFDAAIGGLSAIMGMISPEKSKWTVLNCIASGFEIKKGVATSQVLLVDTEFSTLVGEGEIDLGKETLAMKISPYAKSATLNVAVPVKIGGTFAEPTFRPDELATARRLGGLLGRTMFLPLALLALGDMGSGEDNPCLKIAKADADPSPAKAPEQPSASGAADDGPLDSLKKGLDSLFGKK